MSVNQINKTVKPLSNEALFKVAPSIFSENPIETVFVAVEENKDSKAEIPEMDL